jgi:replicative DNA helicase
VDQRAAHPQAGHQGPAVPRLGLLGRPAKELPLTQELYNHDAETLFLAGLLRHPDAFYSVNDIGITPNDLLGQENRRVLKAITAVVADKKVPELPLVLEELRGGDSALAIEYVNRLMSMACSTAQAIEFARPIKGLSVARQLAQAGADIIETAREYRADADKALESAESTIRKIRNTMPEDERSPDPASILRRMRQGGDERFLPIYFSPTLQDVTGGLRPGHLWVIGGFSSTGKSAVAVNFMIDLLRSKASVMLVSPEMTQEQYLIRLMSAAAMVPQRAIRDHLPGDMEAMDRLAKTERALSNSNLKVYDNIFRLPALTSKAKQVKETAGLDVLIVDYIQLIRGSTGDFAYADTTEVILDLQQLAKDLQITVLAFSQISNEQAKWDSAGSDANVYSFKGSGSVKDAADVAVMLKRDRIGQSSLLNFNIMKNRHGELASIVLDIDLPTGRVSESEFPDAD